MEPVVADAVSIVVLGAMNPSIHHPAWYRHIGIISDAELMQAQAQAVVTPAFATFDIGGLMVTCDTQHWEVVTTQPDVVERLGELSAATFDTLTHTPVRAFGFNFRNHRVVPTADVATLLARRLTPTKVGLANSRASQVQLSVTTPEGHCARTVTIAQSLVAPNMVFVQTNAHYTITKDLIGSVTQFALRPLFDRFFAPERALAASNVDAVVASLSKEGA